MGGTGWPPLSLRSSASISCSRRGARPGIAAEPPERTTRPRSSCRSLRCSASVLSGPSHSAATVASMHASTSWCSPLLVPGTISCGSKRSSAGRKRSQPRLKLAPPSVTSLRGASLRSSTWSRAKGERPKCSRRGVGKTSHARSLRLRATVIGAICSPPMLGSHSASMPACERSSAKSCVSEAPPRRSVRTAERTMRPPSTGTT
mmetsp:Transcript_18302/g.45933  ORF Transcript_18302/g.45933 Transcript_18302/m.45933 type:complete len:204 (-) Transcript_18302:1651-2262(-)